MLLDTFLFSFILLIAEKLRSAGADATVNANLESASGSGNSWLTAEHRST